ncbi:hypothetical protein SK128_019056 [Halocaridina rubra]|uniref:Exonuclease domain-containing protein n=1 Tax=Halocaridina rubra TaxID=373956 RepID=A0AAN8X8A2_HALRR
MAENVAENSTDTVDLGICDVEVNKIQTFVFFDLETTGLAGADTKITELSMVAVSREHLLEMVNNPRFRKSDSEVKSSTIKHSSFPVPMLPRVLHKYSRLYYPYKLIIDDIEKFTGLSNELLHRLPTFSTKSAEAISLFLDLPKPVALVAHNGTRFDFPLVMAELSNVMEHITDSFTFRDLQCVDSLLAIRHIDACIKQENEEKDILEITSLASAFAFDDMSDEDWVDGESLRKKLKPKNPNDTEVSEREKTPPSSGDEEQDNGLEVSIQLPITPLKDRIPATGFGTPQTPVKPKIPPKPPITPESSNSTTSKVNGTCAVRRNLMYGPKKRKWDGTQPFKQTNIYQRLFGGHYDGHRAEADCLALLEICGHYSEKFVKWADLNAYKFTSVKPMWVKRKSLQIK